MRAATGICLSVVGGYVTGCMAGTATFGVSFSWSRFGSALLLAPIGLAKPLGDLDWMSVIVLASVAELLIMIWIAKKSGRTWLAYVGVFIAVALLAFVGGGIVAGLQSLARTEGRVHTSVICGQSAEHAVAGYASQARQS